MRQKSSHAQLSVAGQYPQLAVKLCLEALLLVDHSFQFFCNFIAKSIRHNNKNTPNLARIYQFLNIIAIELILTINVR